MGVSVFPLFAIEEASDETISCTLGVHHLKINGVPDDDTELEIFGRLLADVPDRLGFRWGVLLVDFGPKDASTLRHLSAVMVQLTVLNRLVDDRFPITTEVAIFQVNSRSSNQIITEEKIIVPELYLHERAAREDGLELVHLIDIRARIVFLVVFAIGTLILSENHLDIRIGRTVIVTSCEVESADDVNTHVTFGL